MMVRIMYALCLCGLLVSMNAMAQNYAGVYTANADGEVWTLQLNQLAPDEVSGFLSSKDGERIQLEGEIDDGELFGFGYGDADAIVFQAVLQGGQLLFSVAELDQTGEPDLENAIIWTFAPGTAGGGAPTPEASTTVAPRSTEPAVNPAPPTGEPKAGVPQQAETDAGRTPVNDPNSLLGTWQSHSQGETVMLVFETEDILELDGVSVIYTRTPELLRVQTEEGLLDFQYQLSGKTLKVTSPQGQQFEFVRTSGPGSTAGVKLYEGFEQEGQLREMLTATCWHSWSYRGSSSLSGDSHGTTRSDNYCFFQDGTYSTKSRAETYSGGSAGSVAGQHSGGGDGRWEIRSERLFMSDESGFLEEVDVRLTRNNNGVPFLVIDGVEYMTTKD
jgi:hypothetical protein